MGVGSGGYVTFAYNSLDNYAEVANPTKFNTPQQAQEFTEALLVLATRISTPLL